LSCGIELQGYHCWLACAPARKVAHRRKPIGTDSGRPPGILYVLSEAVHWRVEVQQQNANRAIGLENPSEVLEAPMDRMESVLTEYKDFLLTALDGIDQDIGISLGLVASHMLILETPFLALRFGLCGKRKICAGALRGQEVFP
jgi:hypothetical protein